MGCAIVGVSVLPTCIPGGFVDEVVDGDVYCTSVVVGVPLGGVVVVVSCFVPVVIKASVSILFPGLTHGGQVVVMGGVEFVGCFLWFGMQEMGAWLVCVILWVAVRYI